MAELTNKLHIKSGSTVYDCTCYTTTDEATPKTVSMVLIGKLKIIILYVM